MIEYAFRDQITIRRPQRSYKKYILAASLFTAAFLFFPRQETPKAIVVAPVVHAQQPSISPTMRLSPTISPVSAYIGEVFGADAYKALQLLTCENTGLDPSRINKNHDEAQTEDVGLFQINTHWQQVSRRFLLNYKINTQAAYQIYVESGRSFKMWTCGRRLGI